eukprot:scaffold93325_cov60-Phaeocystis_antarctica.AAC.6
MWHGRVAMLAITGFAVQEAVWGTPPDPNPDPNPDLSLEPSPHPNPEPSPNPNPEPNPDPNLNPNPNPHQVVEQSPLFFGTPFWHLLQEIF